MREPASARELSARAGRALAALVALGFAFVLAYDAARDGFMPLDQSIGFDGGWRILCGQVPLRDYLAPNGFTLHALQALFFAVLGVNWNAYAAHAALFNALALAAAYGLLWLAGARGWRAAPFALATAVVFYPPFGPPYMDTHAFFFSLVALLAALASGWGQSERTRRLGAWCVGPLLALAYLSKQIPSVFFLPLCLGVSAFAREARVATLLRMLGGLAASAFALGLAALALGVDFELADVYLRQLPTEEGLRRLGYVPGVGSVLERFEQTRTQLELVSIGVTHAVGLPALAAALIALPRLVREPNWRWRGAIGAGVMGELVLLASLLFIALTSNDKELGAPLVFVALGLAAQSARCALLAWRPDARLAADLVLAGFAAVALADARSFFVRVVETRQVNDIAPDAVVANEALPAALSGLRWRTPKLVRYTPADLRALVEHLEARPGGMFLVGDASVLYGASGKPSVFPALWFHPGLTFPLPYDARFEAFESMLLERLERYEVRTVGREPRVWVGFAAPPGETPKARLVTLESFPRVARWVSERRVSSRAIGAFEVLELR